MVQFEQENSSPETTPETHYSTPAPEAAPKKSKNFRKSSTVLILVILLLVVLSTIPTVRYKFNALVLRRVSVQILVEDKISGAAIADTAVNFNGQVVHTAADGAATIYEPVHTNHVQIILSAPNFTPAKQTVYFDASHQNKASLDLLHTGNIYFLKQDASYGGTAGDIVQSNLDGSKQKVILQGDGSELQTATDSSGNAQYNGPSLLAAHDWQHLAYLVRNQGFGFDKIKGPEPKTAVRLYIIDTSNNKTSQIDMANQVADNENSSLAMIGWLDNQHFAYSMITASGQEQIKDYDTGTGKVTTLLANKKNQNFSAIYIIGGKLVFAETCAIDGPPDPSINESAGLAACKKAGLQGRIISLSASGGVMTLKQLDQSWLAGIVTNNIYGPDALYFTIYGTKSGIHYYIYNGQAVSSTTQAKAENQKYNPSLASPNGDRVFWLTNAKNGGSELFAANGSGQNATMIQTFPQNYNQYGWYGNYLILSKGGNRLYAAAVNSSKDPVQISEYLPSQKGYDDAMGGYPGASFGYDGIY
jgi:hypothetical protein